MATGCWCTLKFHLPGEKARHIKAAKDAKRHLELAAKVDARKK